MLFLRLFSGCLIQLLPYSMICLYPFKDNYRFTNKKAITFTVVLLSVLSLFFTFSCLYLQKTIGNEKLFLASNIVFMICLIPCFIWYLFITKGIWQKKFFIFFFTLIAALSITSLNNIICTALLINTEIDNLPYGNFSIIILFALTMAVVFLFMKLIQKYFLAISDFLLEQDYVFLSVLSCVLFIIMAVGLIPFDYSNYLINVSTLFLYIILEVCIFFILAMVFRLFYITRKRVESDQLLAQSEAQMQIQIEQYQQLVNQISEIKRLRHDSKHKLIMYREMAAEHKTESLLALLDADISDIDQITIEQYSKNEVINILVSYYTSHCKDKQISMKTNIQYDDDIVFPPSHLSAVLGNLLENAYTAAGKCDESNRNITLNILKKGNHLIITVDNGYAGELKFSNNSYQSTKDSHIGLGLKSITKIAEDHGGSAKFSNDENVFYSSVILPLE